MRRLAGRRSGKCDELLGQIRLAGLPAPETEFRFHPQRKWRFDLAYPSVRLAVEYEGLVWKGKGGRHQRAQGLIADAEKYAEALLLGWRVLRVTSKHVKSGQALAWVTRALETKVAKHG